MKKKQNKCELCFTETSKLTKATLKVLEKDGWKEITLLACNTCIKEENMVKLKAA